MIFKKNSRSTVDDHFTLNRARRQTLSIFDSQIWIYYLMSLSWRRRNQLNHLLRKKHKSCANGLVLQKRGRGQGNVYGCEVCNLKAGVLIICKFANTVCDRLNAAVHSAAPVIDSRWTGLAMFTRKVKWGSYTLPYRNENPADTNCQVLKSTSWF